MSDKNKASEFKFTNPKFIALVLSIIIILFLIYIAPYYLLIMRGAVVHGNRDGTITKEDAQSQITKAYPFTCPYGWAISRKQMDDMYGWWRNVDMAIRYEYWHVTSLEDAIENHTSYTGSTWNY